MQRGPRLSGCGVDPSQRFELVAAIRRVLGDEVGSRGLIQRALEPGDLGWVVERHGFLGATEYAGPLRSKASSHGSSPDSRSDVTTNERRRGSPRSTVSESAVCSAWPLTRYPPRNYACCSWNRRHAVRGWELGWSTSASGSPPDRVTPGSCCGLKMCNWTLEGFISGPDSNSIATSPTTVSAVT